MKLSKIDSVLFACRSNLKLYGDILEDSISDELNSSAVDEIDDLLKEIEKVRTAIRERKVEL